jgi:hypothetical protein
MNIYIPTPKCLPEINNQVINSMLEQTKKCDVVIVVGIKNEGIKQRGIYSPARLKSESETRYLIQGKAQSDNNEYIGMVDNNVVFLFKNTIELMKKRLAENSRIGVVFNKLKKDGHIRIASGLWKKQCLLDADFSIKSLGHCMCDSVIKSIKDKWQVVETDEIFVKKLG